MAIINRDFLEGEIQRTQAAIDAHLEGAEVHKLILSKFKEVLETMPPRKKVDMKSIKPKNAVPIGVG